MLREGEQHKCVAGCTCHAWSSDAWRASKTCKVIRGVFEDSHLCGIRSTFVGELGRSQYRSVAKTCLDFLAGSFVSPGKLFCRPAAAGVQAHDSGDSVYFVCRSRVIATATCVLAAITSAISSNKRPTYKYIYVLNTQIHHLLGRKTFSAIKTIKNSADILTTSLVPTRILGTRCLPRMILNVRSLRSHFFSLLMCL